MNRILIVEDDPAVLRGLKDNLRFESYDVLTASDGEHAYRLIHDERPDLVVMDVMLPGMWGSEVCRRIRADGVTTPIVMLTARSEESDRVLGLDLGADDYVSKPFALRELCARIRSILRNRRGALVDYGRLAEELRSAADVQRTLFPRAAPLLRTLDCAGVCRPASAVGGDYYDYIPIGGGRVALVLADIAGKGMPAALRMASLHGLIRAQAAGVGTAIDSLLESINDLLHQQSGRPSFATLFYGVYDDGSRALQYVNAGHPPPMVVSRGAEPRIRLTLSPTCSPPGMFERIAVSTRRVQLQPEDWLVICSDGVLDALNPGDEEFGRDGLAGAVHRHAEGSARDMCHAVLDAVAGHQDGAPQHDDMTMLAARVRSVAS